MTCAVPFRRLLMGLYLSLLAAQHGATLTPPICPRLRILASSLSEPSVRERQLNLVDRILISNVPNDCLSRAMGLSGEHWNITTMPILQLCQEDVPQVLFTAIL